jgi:multiple sugar transport system ATP-binding protein
MASIRIKDITKKFGKTTALDNLSFHVNDGEFFCILGPPGAGKTTTLRTIIGLESPDEGAVYINDDRVNEVHPSRRDIAMIFQNLALYPDKTVFDNIASPLRRLRLQEEEIKSKVVDVSKQLKIDWLLTKTPAQLSGGERQRVAIGRAIVRQPRAYLMDEPLSNLDALLRIEMRLSLKELQTNLKETFVYATHDQAEALSMADRIAILDRGVLQQLGRPEEVYKYPENQLVATVLGNPSMNFLECQFKEKEDKIYLVHEAFSVWAKKEVLHEILENSKSADKELIVGIRPEDVTIRSDKPEGSSIEAEIYVTEPLGNKTIVDIKIGKDVIKVIDKPSFKGEPGQRVWLQMKEAKFHLFEKRSSKCIYHASEGSRLRFG